MSSYRQILKSTSLIGGSTVVDVLVRIVQFKVVAVLLGPTGVALLGLYAAAIGVATTVAGLGIGSSAVRQIAEANGQEDRQKIARTIVALRRIVLLTGTLGALATLVLCVPISRLTFGDASYAGAFALLSLSVLFTTISAGQTALIQGMRRIRDLATIRVVSSLLGVSVTICLVWAFRERGVVLSLVAVAAVSTLVAWWFARGVPHAQVRLAWHELCQEARGLIGLGLAFMFAAVTGAVVTYLIRTLVVRQLGLDAAGYYQAAFGLAGIYVGLVLSAMGADFYPRLTAAANDNVACNRLVNEQCHVGLLVAAPGVIATFVLAPWVIKLFFSADFLPAVEVLRWQILGVFGRVISWPPAYIILAKGKGRLFVVAELVTNVVHVTFIFFAMRFWGLIGTGVAFAGLYLFHTIFIRWIAGRLSGFRWDPAFLRLLSLYGVAIGVVFATPMLVNPIPALLIGSVLIVVTVAFSAYSVYHLLGAEYVSHVYRKISGLIGLS